MKKKITGEDVNLSFAKELKSKRLVIGTNRVVKALKQGKIGKVYVSSNCKDTTKSDIYYYGKLGNIEIIEVGYSNAELGILCKKPFSISVLGLAKE